MRRGLDRQVIRIATGLLVGVAGSAALWALEMGRQRDSFDTQARIVHRLLSQRAAENEAMLATLTLLQPQSHADVAQRLQAIYPHLLAVEQRSGERDWSLPSLARAEVSSQQSRNAVMADAQLARGRYWLVRAGQPASFALRIDMAAAVPWSEWPLPRENTDTSVELALGPQRFVVQAAPEASHWGPRFTVSKTLATESQPLEVRLSKVFTPAQWPWIPVALWWIATAVLIALLSAWQQQRRARARAEELLRIGQVGRLNALGEMAAGLAHELNQPLTAVLANTQGAGRLLSEDPPDLAAARSAMTSAAQQARRASDVLARVRRGLVRDEPGAARALRLEDAVRDAFELLQPEFARRGVVPQFRADAHPRVQAERVALDQILHNLLMNALQALEQVPSSERSLSVRMSREDTDAVLDVIDSGPGVPEELLPRIFEPFVTTRAGGLGLGLPLCESLATAMGGSLSAHAVDARGARFRLTLPTVP